MRALKTCWTVVLVVLPMLLTACNDDDDRDRGFDPVAPMITAPSATLANGIVDMAVTPLSVTASGTGPIAFSVTSGMLPPGITLNPQTGQYSGIPTTPGMFQFTVTATSPYGSNSRAFLQSVFQRPAITGPVTPLIAGEAGSLGHRHGDRSQRFDADHVQRERRRIAAGHGARCRDGLLHRHTDHNGRFQFHDHGDELRRCRKP